MQGDAAHDELAQTIDEKVDGAVLVPGNLDGVHLGHQALLKCGKNLSRQGNVVALTFDPHPLALIAPDRVPGALTSAERRVELLKQAGATDVWRLHFSAEMRDLSPRDFVAQHFVERAQLQFGNLGAVVVGPDFRFGKDRAGDFGLLTRLGVDAGFRVLSHAPVVVNGQRVSSTAIRIALQNGDIELAKNMLGRAYDFDGLVVTGDQRGRTIGFPTANLQTGDLLLPKHGVYSVWTAIHGGNNRLAGVMNIGHRPTAHAGFSVEVHLLDGGHELYGKRLRVFVVERLRDEKKFASMTELKAQIESDCAYARKTLIEKPPCRIQD